MEWVKLATQFYNDPAFDDLTPNAERLFIRCLAFAGAVESGGVLTQKQIKRVGILNASRYVSELVQARLWVQTESGDIAIRSWSSWQESADELVKRKEADRERQRRHREKSRDGSRDVTRLEKTREEKRRVDTPKGVSTTPSAEPQREPEPAVVLFEKFWTIYPRKVAKKTAKAKYVAAVKRAGSEQVLVDGARRLASDPNLPEPRFIPHATTWLERDGWEDEPLPSRFGGASPQASQRSWLDVAREADARDGIFEGQVIEFKELG